MRYLLDTNICIEALKNRPPEILQRLREVGPEAVAVSVITSLELRHGAERSQHAKIAHAKLDRFLAPITIIPFDQEAALIGARIRAHLDRQGTPIGDLDSLIAAQAIAGAFTLVTNNLREFQRVPDLKTDNWQHSL